jgi:predicted TIM-barrel fold metal-dependent hydrolase
MHLFDEPKIDCHPHVLDPQRFPYAANVSYRPAGQEIAPATQALLVQPNSGYERDNSCMLDAIARGEGRLKGISIVDLDVDTAMLKTLKAQGIVGAALNPTSHVSRQ